MESLEKEARQALANAADYIETHGWIQGRLRDNDTGAVCTRGALVMAKQTHIYQPALFDVAEDLLLQSLGLQDHWSLPEWNDEPHRTAEQVVKELRKAAGQL